MSAVTPVNKLAALLLALLTCAPVAWADEAGEAFEEQGFDGVFFFGPGGGGAGEEGEEERGQPGAEAGGGGGGNAD